MENNLLKVLIKYAVFCNQNQWKINRNLFGITFNQLFSRKKSPPKASGRLKADKIISTEYLHLRFAFDRFHLWSINIELENVNNAQGPFRNHVILSDWNARLTL